MTFPVSMAKMQWNDLEAFTLKSNFPLPFIFIWSKASTSSFVMDTGEVLSSLLPTWHGVETDCSTASPILPLHCLLALTEVKTLRTLTFGGSDSDLGTYISRELSFLWPDRVSLFSFWNQKRYCNSWQSVQFLKKKNTPFQLDRQRWGERWESYFLLETAEKFN